MKWKLVCLTTLCAALLTACAWGKPPQTDELIEVREMLTQQGAIAGICYLGYYEGDGAFSQLPEVEASLKEYPFLKEIPKDRLVQADGAEVYCMIPADPEASVEVTEWSMETSTAGETLYQGGGEPILLQGNVSDILPNLSVTITDPKGDALEQYQPFISLEDGMVGLPEESQPELADLTIYGAIFGEQAENETDDAVG